MKLENIEKAKALIHLLNDYSFISLMLEQENISIVLSAADSNYFSKNDPLAQSESFQIVFRNFIENLQEAIFNEKNEIEKQIKEL